MTTPAKIEARIAGRKQAADISSLLTWPDGHGAEFGEAFIDTMRGIFPQRKADIVAEEKPVPIARLGATEIPFGKYQGQAFDDVPTSYLDWLCREQESFYKNLRAYLKHPELQTRRGGN